MDIDEGADLADRVSTLHVEDMEAIAKMIVAHAEATLQALGARMAGGGEIR